MNKTIWIVTTDDGDEYCYSTEDNALKAQRAIAEEYAKIMKYHAFGPKTLEEAMRDYAFDPYEVTLDEFYV